MVVSVEEVSSSLVREYLSRKGLRRTAACMDEESPRTETSINNRSQLRRTLDLDGLYRENKVQGSPLKTLLEIMVKYHIAAPGDDRKASGGRDPLQSAPAPALTPTPTPPATPAPAPAFSPALSPASALSPDPAPSSAPTPAPSPVTPTAIVSAKAEAVMSKHAKLRSDIEDKYTPSFPETDGLSGCDQSGCWAYRPGETRGPPLLAPVQDKESFRRREPEKKTPVTESTQRNRSNRIRRGMMAGPIASTPQETNKKRQSRRIEVPRALLRKEEQQRQWRDGFPPNSSESSRAEINSAGEKQQLLRASHSLKTRKVKSRPNVPDLEVSEMVLDDFDDEDDLQELSKVSFDRTVAEHSSAGHPIGQRAVVELKELLLGSSLNCFSIEWRNQGFTFSETHDLRYGIVQKKGGPCGVLASVQAFVLKKLLFENTEKTNEDLERLRPFSNTRRKCLVLAVAEILWRAGEEKQATVAVSGRNQFTPTGNFRSAGVLEKLTCFTVDNITDLQSLVQQHIEQFETGVLGCILLTISAILSRSIEKVREDMDVPTTTLIGAHGYCTQELVNLLLCGRAVSNVFDDDMELDSGNGNVTLLKGIKGQCDVGLLSLFEHYNICKVGAYLKTPSYPIWVVCSESHFSVLFGLQRELLTNPDRGLEFDLYYYDGLANQQEEIRLTVSVAKLDASCQDDDTDLIPPLEHCIRTRWRDAFVNWNDTEPIL